MSEYRDEGTQRLARGPRPAQRGPSAPWRCEAVVRLCWNCYTPLSPEVPLALQSFCSPKCEAAWVRRA
jgi:hypothetical protein